MRNTGFLLLLAAVTLVIPATVPAAGAARYRGYATCNIFQPHPDHRCMVGDGYGAAFIARRRTHVRYILCVRNLKTGSKKCFRRNTGRRSKPATVWLFNRRITENPGLYRLKWRLPARGVVARATLRVLVGD